jgi:hypothetical protein
MDKYTEIRKYLKSSLTGRTSAEIKEQTPELWQEIITKAENREDGFYREPYHSQHWGQYYRYKSKI